MSTEVVVVGGGLAGSEAAWQLAQRGFQVKLYEMRPVATTGAHTSNQLAELVCSNSLGSKLPDRASGLLQSELNMLGSLLMGCAEKTRLALHGCEEAVELLTRWKMVCRKRRAFYRWYPHGKLHGVKIGWCGYCRSNLLN